MFVTTLTASFYLPVASNVGWPVMVDTKQHIVFCQLNLFHKENI